MRTVESLLGRRSRSEILRKVRGSADGRRQSTVDPVPRVVVGKFALVQCASFADAALVRDHPFGLCSQIAYSGEHPGDVVAQGVDKVGDRGEVRGCYPCTRRQRSPAISTGAIIAVAQMALSLAVDSHTENATLCEPLAAAAARQAHSLPVKLRRQPATRHPTLLRERPLERAGPAGATGVGHARAPNGRPRRESDLRPGVAAIARMIVARGWHRQHRFHHIRAAEFVYLAATAPPLNFRTACAFDVPARS